MNLLSNNDRRRLQIIEILTYSNDDYTVKEITKKLGVSERTFYRDLNAINQNFKYIKIEYGDFLKISYDKTYSIHRVYRDVMKDQAIFNLIEKIMLQDDLSISYLSAILGVSAPTMYRNISDFNSSIGKKYGFEIETSPCKFTGSEAGIRAFLTQYIVEAHGFYSWPFENIREADVEAFLNTLFTSLGYSSDYSLYQNAKIIVAINLLFSRRNRKIEDIQTYGYLLDQLDQTVALMRENESLSWLFSQLGLDLNIEGVLQVAYPFVSKCFLPGYPFLLESTSMPGDLLGKIRALQNLVESVEKKVSLNPEMKPSLVVRLYNGLSLGYYSPYADYILFENGHKFYHSMKDMAPEIVEMIDRKFREVYPLFGLKPSDTFHRHMVNILLMNWPNFMPQLIGADVTSKILIVSDLGVGHASMYKFRFKSELLYFTTVDVYDRNVLSVDWINKHNYKYVISNCDLDGLSEPTSLMVISTCPTARDFDLIRNTFAQAAGNRNMCALPGNMAF